MQKLMIDSETGLRGYFLTKNPTFLEPYVKSKIELPQTVSTLKTLIAEDPQQLDRVHELESKFSKWSAYWQTIQDAEHAGNANYLGDIRNTVAKKMMDQIRGEFDLLVNSELNLKRIQKKQMTRNLYQVIWLGGAFSLVIAAFMVLIARQTLAQVFRVYQNAVDQNKIKSDRQLRVNEQRFRTYIDAMPQMAFISDLKGNITYFNGRWYDYVGSEGTEGWGWINKEILHPDDVEKMVERWNHSLESEEPYQGEYRLRRVDGVYRWHLGRAVPVRDQHGNAVEWLGTNTDIEDQKALSERLRIAKEEAEKASLVKSAFLANMSHEMRTPLGIMIGVHDLIRENATDHQEVESLLKIASRNSAQLFRLINDVLDLAKVEAEALQMELVKFEIKEFIEDVAMSLQVKAREKGLTLDIQLEEPMPETFESDVFRMKQILLNLIGNAIKFTDEGSVKVTVRTLPPKLHNQKVQLEFKIVDTGIGLNREQSTKLFQPFMQADSSSTRKYGGTGLGLVLSRKYAQALGGDVELTNSEPGSGSTFKMWIQDGVITELNDTLTEKQKISYPDISQDVAHTDEPPLEGLKVLLVDDAEDNRFLISRFLKTAGAKVECAENGLVGIEKSLNGDFDIVLMDIQMPVLDGEKAMLQLREMGFDKPITALTANAMKGDRDRSLQMGFSDYLTKPVNRSELITRLSIVPISNPPC